MNRDDELSLRPALPEDCQRQGRHELQLVLAIGSPGATFGVSAGVFFTAASRSDLVIG